jgi:predicted O-methyltransferase YrrM
MLPDRVEVALARASAAGFTMSCDASVGRLLAVVAAATPPHGRIVELGTGCGVGLAWLVHGLEGRDDVEVISIEQDHAVAALTRSDNWPSCVSIVEGDAVSRLPKLGTFDLVFADSEGGKWEGLEATTAAVRVGGHLIVDDMNPPRWESAHHREKTEEVRAHLLTHPDLVAVEIAHGSGVVLCTRQPA